MTNSDNKLPQISNEATKTNLREAMPQILAVAVKNVLLLGFGMTLGFPTILIPNLQGNNPDEKISLGPEAISWIGSINLICVPIGCLTSGAITQPIGRKRAMQLVNIPFLTAWLMFHFSTEVWQIFFALALTGLSGGLLEAPVLTYVAEITQPYLRGMLSSSSTLAVILGTLFQFLLGTFYSFRTVALINCCIPILSFILLIFVPETPHWLLSKNRVNDARESLAWLRGWTTIDKIEPEFQELCKHLSKNLPSANAAVQSSSENLPIFKKATKLETLKLFTKKNFLWPYFLVSLAFFLGHFNGMTTLQTYAITIFSSLKAPIDKYYCTILLGVVELLGCITCITLVHYLGKRILNIVTLIISGICYVTVATYANMVNIQYLDTKTNQTTQEFHWVPLTFLIISAFASYLGIKILPWILSGEVFSNETRAVASGLAAAMAYIFGFFANKTFLSMISTFTLPGTFWTYGAVSFIGALLIYFLLPETEGKTLHEIEDHFNGNTKMGFKTLTYVAEITTPNLRGILASTASVSVILGSLIQFLLGTFFHWRTVALINSIAPIISFTLYFFVPESPHWLISKNRLEEGQKSLAWLRGWKTLDEVNHEFQDLHNQLKHNENLNNNLTKIEAVKLFSKRNFIWPFTLVCYGFFLGYFSGMLTLQTYAVSIFATMKSPIDKYYATIFLGVAQVLGCLVSVFLIHRVGKRVLNIFSLLGMCFCFIIVGSYAHLLKIQDLNPTNSTIILDNSELVTILQTNTWIPLACILLGAFICFTGIRILPWMLIGEVFSPEIRPMASGMAGAVSYFFGFTANKTFLRMVGALTLAGTFWFYSCMALLGAITLYFWLPETEGKTLFAITEHFAGRHKLGKKVLRHKKSQTNGHVNEAYKPDKYEQYESRL